MKKIKPGSNEAWIHFMKIADYTGLERIFGRRIAKWIMDNRGTETFEKECKQILEEEQKRD